MTAADIIQRAEQTLHDPTHVRWTLPMLYNFITDAQRTAIVLRPDLNPVVTTIQLTAGSTLQHIPNDGHSLLDVIRNVTSQGVPTGNAVTLTSKSSLDAENMNWHLDTPSTHIKNFAYDERVLTDFYVTPPAGANAYVEIKYSKIPAIITDGTDPIEISEMHAEALSCFVLYRAFSMNIDSVQDQSRAKQYLAIFYQLLGQAAQAAALLSPNNTNINPTINVQAPNQ